MKDNNTQFVFNLLSIIHIKNQDTPGGGERERDRREGEERGERREGMERREERGEKKEREEEEEEREYSEFRGESDIRASKYLPYKSIVPYLLIDDLHWISHFFQTNN